MTLQIRPEANQIFRNMAHLGRLAEANPNLFSSWTGQDYIFAANAIAAEMVSFTEAISLVSGYNIAHSKEEQEADLRLETEEHVEEDDFNLDIDNDPEDSVPYNSGFRTFRAFADTDAQARLTESESEWMSDEALKSHAMMLCDQWLIELKEKEEDNLSNPWLIGVIEDSLLGDEDADLLLADRHFKRAAAQQNVAIEKPDGTIRILQSIRPFIIHFQNAEAETRETKRGIRNRMLGEGFFGGDRLDAESTDGRGKPEFCSSLEMTHRQWEERFMGMWIEKENATELINSPVHGLLQEPIYDLKTRVVAFKKFTKREEALIALVKKPWSIIDSNNVDQKEARKNQILQAVRPFFMKNGPIPSRDLLANLGGKICQIRDTLDRVGLWEEAGLLLHLQRQGKKDLLKQKIRECKNRKFNFLQFCQLQVVLFCIWNKYYGSAKIRARLDMWKKSLRKSRHHKFNSPTVERM